MLRSDAACRSPNRRGRYPYQLGGRFPRQEEQIAFDLGSSCRVYTVQDPLVSSIAGSGSGAGRPTAMVDVSFTKLTQADLPTCPNGGAAGAPNGTFSAFFHDATPAGGYGCPERTRRFPSFLVGRAKQRATPRLSSGVHAALAYY
jgi:hypothetical protein